MHQDFAQLQCIDVEWLQCKTDLECTFAHQIESSLGNSLARSIDLVGSWQWSHHAQCNPTRSLTVVVRLIKIASYRNKRAQCSGLSVLGGNVASCFTIVGDHVDVGAKCKKQLYT
jgi:hypothetical protein